MDYLERLVAERQRAWHRAQEIMDLAASEDRDVTTEERTLLDEIDADLTRRDEDIRTTQARQERAALADRAREQYAPIIAARTIETTSDPSDGQIIRAMIDGERSSHTFDTRALAKSANTDPVLFADFLTVTLRDVNPIYTLARKMTTTGGNTITLPRLTADAAGTMIAEAGTITPTDATFDSLSIKAYKFMAVQVWSAEVDEDNGVNLEQWLGTGAGQTIGLLAGSYFTVGTGTVQPQGILGFSNGGTASGTYFVSDDIVGLPYKVKAAGRSRGVFAMATTAMSAARKLKTTTGEYLWQPSYQAGEPDRIAGYPVYEIPHLATNGSASKSIVFFDPQSFLVREVSGVRVTRSEELYLLTDQIALRTIWRADSIVLDSTAGAVLTNNAV